MISAKFYRITLISLIWALILALMPNTAASAIEENDKKLGVKSVKQINEESIRNIGQEDLDRRIHKSLNALTESGIRIDKEYMEMEKGFDAFAQDATIDMTLTNVDVASILRIIAKEGGMNVVIDESVMGFITAELKGISLNEAMQTILTSEELESRVSNKTIFVASRPAMTKKGLNRKYIKTFKLNNSNAVYIADILKASIFNKGYKVNEQSSGSAFQAVPISAETQSTNATGTSTGQSSLIDSKTIKGKVESLESTENFGDAGTLASKIKIQHYTSRTSDIAVDNNDGGAIVIPDTRTNSLLIAGLKSDILLAEEAIKYLDKPLKQVSIKVSLIELKKSDSKDLGLSTSMQGGKTQGGFNVPTAFNGNNFTSLANQSGITVNTVSSLADEVAVKINSMLYKEEAKLLADPTIIALDGSESLIKITDQVLSKVETTITDSATTYNAELADVGIVLNILPKIGNEDYVTMRIRPSITSSLPTVEIGATQVGAAAISVTPISTREVILQDVRIKSGETLAIAGLSKENDVEKVGKIPLLANIPFFGKVFTNTDFEHQKTELIILITPVIIDDIAYNEL
ncbi:MAG TPA: secretin N-terminal domain-containing protein [Candidatus Gastranaerophilales bacterium]|nr:secretin N-terminal domain-containing protein [Candidatus Gastranaerophilales bacterium]